LYFYSGSSGTFDYCTIEYTNSGIYATSGFTGAISIDNCTIQNNGYGVRARGGTLTLRGNSIENNTNHGINIDGSALDLGANNPSDKGNNTIQNNDGGVWQVYNNSSNTVNAYYNFWGYTTESEIDAHIYDDEEASKGKVFFDHWLAGEPTLIVLSTFTAKEVSDGVLLSWSTESEVDTAGFNIYRSEDKSSGYVKLNDALIPGSTDSTTGETYSFIDETVANGISYYYKLEEVELDGAKTTHGPISVTPIEEMTETEKGKVVPDKTEIEPSILVVEPPLPEKYLLAQNFPNPFNPNTWIPYALPEVSYVIIRIYNISGQLVRTLDLGDKPAGVHFTKQQAAYWDGRNEAGKAVVSGVYFYNIRAGNFSATRRMVIVK